MKPSELAKTFAATYGRTKVTEYLDRLNITGTQRTIVNTALRSTNTYFAEAEKMKGVLPSFKEHVACLIRDELLELNAHRTYENELYKSLTDNFISTRYKKARRNVITCKY